MFALKPYKGSHSALRCWAVCTTKEGGVPMKLYTRAEDFPDLFLGVCSVVLRIWPIGFKYDNLISIVEGPIG